MAKKYKIGDVIEVTIEKIVPRGFGLGFVPDLTLLVPLSAPGDELRVRLKEIKKRLAFAEIVEVKRAGSHRTAPPCVYFGRCGGCDFQQLDYPAQLDSKVDIIRDCLIRIGKIEFPHEIPIVPSPQAFGYRSRARWHVDTETTALGYMARDTHNVIDVHECPILTSGAQSALEYVRESLDWEAFGSGGGQIEAATGDEGRVSTYSRDLFEPTAHLVHSIAGDRYAFSAQTFFQANKLLIPQLIEAAVGGAEGVAALDLYCGVGLFTLPLARRFETVVAVEEDAVSSGFAQQNVDRIRAANVRIVNDGVKRFLRSGEYDRHDFVLLDPPRSGTERGTIALIAAAQPAEISYVSCEPSILARDLRSLLDAGYDIEKVTALDLFPQTHHVETVVRLRRAEPPA